MTSRFSLLSTCLLATVVAAGPGCTLPKVPVPTLWQKLGIPQASLGARDHFANRDGLNPDRERKLPLKRLADPELLQAENPAIKLAAKIKTEEDLAEQKIKALRYLASIGCGCYDKDGEVQKALLAALQDCTPEVRMVACEAIRTAACNPCANCSCANGGCCCGKEIQEQLKKMATEEKDGCFFEPSAQIRAAAARALAACPPLPETPVTPPVEGNDPVVPVEGAGTTDGIGVPVPMGSIRRNGATRSISYRQEFSDSQLVAAKVSAVDAADRLMELEFDRPFRFPTGLKMVLFLNGNELPLEVVSTATGVVRTRITDSNASLNGIGPDTAVRIGVLEASE
ncbi:MAG TPA: hypothetical protein PLI18_05370 [Pirellulaceae bacterium]|nr:hypothetical protein [Pirellulaceae bacterium]